MLAYGVLAAVWIYASDTLLNLASLDAVTAAQLSLTKGLLFVLVSGVFFYVQLRDARALTGNEALPGASLWSVLLAFSIVSTTVAVIVYLAFQEQQSRLSRAAIAALESTADLKAHQIEAWLDERRGNAQVLAQNAAPVLASGTLPDHRQRRLLETVRSAYGYSYMVLFSQGCRPVATLGEAPTDLADGRLAELCAATRRSGEIQFSDLYLDPASGGDGVRLDLAVPVLAQDEAAEAEILVLGINPERYLYPLVASWPAPSETAETLLVRREGDQVRFLNVLRHREGAALSLTLPLSSPDLPAALALSRGISTMSGVDYRGVPVFAATRPVAGTTWQLVAKIDRREALAELTAAGRHYAIIASLIIVAAGFAILVLLREQRRHAYFQEQQQLLESKLLAKHYDYLSKYANDAILLTDDAYTILDANDRAVELYDRPRAELIGMPSFELQAAAVRDQFDDQLGKVRSDSGHVFETVHRARDGREFPVEVSTRAIEIDGVRRFQAIVRDISERKAAESELLRSESLLRLFFDLPFIGMAITSAETKRWMRFNDRLCEILGYPREELGAMTWTQITHPDDLAADIAEFEKVLSGMSDGYTMDKRFLRKDGIVVDASIDVKVARKADGTVDYFVAMIQDISARKRAELALIRQKNLYAALSETNKAIIHLHTRETVFHELCRVAVERGGFLFAWIGLVDTGSGEIKPVARSGNDSGYIDAIRVSSDAAIDEGRGPGGLAVREGCHQLVNDLDSAAHLEPWVQAARRAGVGSFAALPVREGGKVIGILSVYAHARGFFDDSVVALLDEMVADLGFALDNIERERLRAIAARDLQAAETRWSFALEGAGHGVWEWNTQTNRAFFSHRWKSMLGYSDDEIGDTLHEWESRVHPEDLLAVRDALERHLHGQTTLYVAEHRLRARDGSYRWILARGKTMTRDVQGRPLLLIGTHTDITQMKEAEQERHESEVRFRRAIEEAPFPIMLHAEDGEVVALSRAWTDLSGYALADIPTTEAWTDKAYGSGKEPVMEEIESLYALARRKDEGEYRIRTRQGDERVWQFSSVGLGRAADGRRIAMSMAADVTDRERTEQALQESEERFRGLVEQSLAGIYIVDNERLTYANPRTAEIFGYLPREIIGKPVSELVAPEDRELVRGNIARRIAGEVRSLQYTFRGCRKDGSIVNLGVHGSRAIIRDEPVVIGVMQDITEKLRTEAQISNYVARLERSIMGTVDAVSRMVEMRDPYTSGHERRVGQLAAAIAREMGFSEDSAHGLEITGWVHDIGKIIVPAEILSKPGKLAAIEFEMVKTHAEQGYQVLKDIDFPWPVAEIARQHHERMDGSGYPRGLKGEEILLEARIMAVADVVEAMATHRPYRPGLGIDAALAEIERNSGTSYDPRVAQACLRLFREKDYSLPA